MQLRLLTKLPVHEVCCCATGADQQCRSAPVMQVGGGWNQQQVTQVYAPMQSGDSLAQRARFSSRNTFMLFHTLLDPSELPDFKDMVISIFPEAEDLLQQVQKVIFATLLLPNKGASIVT